ncbi:hypothetical protein K493DRAFT_333742 [Basidiobolus meristosporus CBS 931.73]|uniref:Adhesin domain-containing protein n=1 Tax=Basidiobolus meristosporus CBS 931.73 TaxID=1314790 RepID=A0A1Y1Z3S4_9FUNG|nr:hypothetical protein K493DRAFT_333742 [Basidiobolus meristosporus CBS 931.73]|eukprot:ORY04920.1 hypothetical protein K493DRAFT_333742 [Basidiobolus meristosporus CBS 931.73]
MSEHPYTIATKVTGRGHNNYGSVGGAFEGEEWFPSPHHFPNEGEAVPGGVFEDFVIDLAQYRSLFIIVNTTAAAKSADQPANATIRVQFPPVHSYLKNLNVSLPAGTVNGASFKQVRFDNLNIRVDHGRIAFEDIRSSNISLSASVGEIAGTYSFSQAYEALSRNGSIDCRLRVLPRSIPNITVGTSVGNITARVIDTFRGTFSLFTKFGRTSISGGRHIAFSTNTTTAKSGIFREENSSSNISMHTDKGGIMLSFRRRL